MPITATKSKDLYSQNGYKYILNAYFIENSVNQANNTSNITCRAKLTSTGASWSSSQNSNLTIYWHDNKEGYDRQVSTLNFSSCGAGITKTAEGTITVTHNDDGKLSGYAYAWFSKGGNSAYTPISGGVQTNLTALTPIPRGSQPSINSCPDNSPNFNIGDTITIHMNRKSSAFTHSVYFNYGSTSIQVATGVTNNCTFNTSTIANQLYQLIPNAKYYSGTISVTTYDGSTEVGTNTCNYNAYVTNSNPVISTASYKDNNSSIVAITNNNQEIVRNKSTLVFSVQNLQAQNYATLSSCIVTFNSVTKTFTGISGTTVSSQDVTYGTVNLASDEQATITLIDSRGFTTTKTINVTILDYQNQYSSITCQRQSNYYTATDLKVDCTYSSLNNKNQITIQYQTKKTTDVNYGALTTINNNTSYTIQLDNNYQWNVRVVTTDSLGTVVSYVLFVDRGIPLIFFDRLLNSVGINGFPTVEESLEVDGVNILKKLLGTELYNNSTGSKDAITLSESTANFTYIEIFYRNNDNYYNSTKIYQPNGKIAYLDADYPYTQGEGYSYAKKTSVQIQGTSITPINYTEMTIMPNGATIQNKNNIYITRVVGY